jgi:hypothetical protein
MAEPERCDECGFDATRLTVADAIAALRSLGRRWREAFREVPVEVLRERPDPAMWSPIEYAAHTRDVLTLIGAGLEEALDDRRPAFPAMEPDPPGPVAADHGYNALEPGRVLDELEAGATAMAARAKRALPEHWARTATVGDRELDAGWAIRHAVHDATHHLRDVERILEE